jgi:hypothetical protein
LTQKWVWESKRRRRQERGREESHSETKKNQSWDMLPGDQRRVTSPQMLKQSMK